MVNSLDNIEEGLPEGEKLVAVQKDRLAQLKQIFKNFKKDGAARKTKIYCEQRIRKVETINKEFNECHRIIVGEINDKKHEYFAKDLFQEFDELVLDAICAITESLQTTLPALPTPETIQVQPATHTTLVKLPKLPLPTFSGKFTEWPAFYDAFRRLIHINSDLSDMQKFHFLKEALPAHELDIKQMNLTDNNYSTAWNLLIQRYNNPRLLFMNHMNSLFSLPVMHKERSEDIKSLLNVAKVCINELLRLEIPINTCDHWLAYHITTKLSQETLRAYEHHLGDSTTVPSFSTLETFLNNRLVSLNVLENRSSMQTTFSKPANEFRKLHNQSQTSNVGRKIHHVTAKGEKEPQCVICKEKHVLRRCPKFLSKDCFSKLSIANAHEACTNCLSTAHKLEKCPSSKGCSVCGQRHHTSLHTAESQPSQNSSESRKVAPSSGTNSNSAMQVNTAQLTSYPSTHPESPTVLLATALVALINDTTGEESIVRALVDPGSEGTLISEHIVQNLNIKRYPISVKISGVGESRAATSKYKVNCSLRSLLNTHFVLSVDGAYVLPTLTTNLPSQRVTPQNWTHLAGLTLADPQYHQPRRVDLILGVDIYAQIIQPGLRIGTKAEPIAQNTSLGWILSGTVKATENEPIRITCNVSTLELEELIQRFYKQEQISDTPAISTEDEWCEQYFQTTHQRQANGKYLVRLPLKSIYDQTKTLGKSRQIALNRFYHLERKFQRDNQLYNRYKACIDEYFALNQITPVTTTEKQNCVVSPLSKPTVTSCVLPHHAVIKEESLSTKLRVVFDASCKTSNGRSLNENLCVGPPLQNDLATIILKWRFHKYVFTADIQKMYRCIDMHLDDSQYQRILWKDDKGHIKEFCLTTVTFGTASAPYTAIRVLHQLSEDEGQRYPLAPQVLKHDIYVDDVMSGHHTIETALKIRNDVNAALASAGMHLRKWSSNDPALLEGIPPEHLSHSKMLQFNDKTSIKTLGIGWHPKEDIFKVQFNGQSAQTATKRNILSNTFRLFDPLGLISPVIVTVKILLKEIWMTRLSGEDEKLRSLDWDDPLPNHLERKWATCLANLQQVNILSIPRWVEYDPSQLKSAQLHLFSDGSNNAYAAAAYVRFQYSNNNISTHLLMSKCRVTPIKQLTTPRIELCGALLAAQLAKWINSSITISGCELSTYFWTDAQIVLHWINGTGTKLDVYVSNRITKIKEITRPDQWRHISTVDNPVDCATKGLSPAKLEHFTLWWTGPTWLSLPSTDWPNTLANKVFLYKSKQAENTLNVNVSIPEESIIFRYSSLNKLITTVAYVLRYRFNGQTRHRHCRIKGPLSVEEVRQSLRRIVQLVQQEVFGAELSALKANKPLANNSQAKGLSPFLDDNGVIRVGGRLRNAVLQYSRKHPIILPSSHHFTELVITDAHIRTLHGGPTLTISTLRQQFWIVNAKRVVPLQLRKCIICFRNKPTIEHQRMGDLPFHRVNPPTRPFLATGVDYTGALELKSSRFRGNTRYKGYIIIFICLATKAIHLEAATGMSTQDFLWALERFISRRGICKDLYSDCGTNFIGANTVLNTANRKLMRDIETKIIPNLALQHIKWHFNPPHSPNFGGLWEANIKSVKRHLNCVAKGKIMTYEELSTLLTRIEACLNSRPLCPLKADLEDLEALTPAHFLIGGPMNALPETFTKSSNLNSMHTNMQKQIRQFWQKWSTDWLSHLQTRPKWCTSTENLRVHDLVIIKDDRLPPTEWNLGRITETHPGKDQLVRVVTVRTQHGLYKRSVSKLCRLPIPTFNDAIDTPARIPTSASSSNSNLATL